MTEYLIKLVIIISVTYCTILVIDMLSSAIYGLMQNRSEVNQSSYGVGDYDQKRLEIANRIKRNAEIFELLEMGQNGEISIRESLKRIEEVESKYDIDTRSTENDG